MNKICTSLEQSKKLIELGIDTDTADMCYKCLGEDPYDLIVRPYSDWKEEYKVLLRSGDAKVYPAWSLVALLRLMPFHIIENNQRYGFYQVKGFNKQGETYHFGYETNNISFLFETSWYNDVIDAAFEIICWLKKNLKI